MGDLLKDLVLALSQQSKGNFVRALTCGDVDAALEDCSGKCTDIGCNKCGFARLWSNGLRPSLVQQKKGK